MKKLFILSFVAIVLIFTLNSQDPAAALVGNATCQDDSPDELALPQTSYPYDLSAIDEWCGEPIGKIRMIAGWLSNPGEIETEDGNLWGISTPGIEENDLLLIWFDDMGTPDVSDDIIMKIWKEVHD